MDMASKLFTFTFTYTHMRPSHHVCMHASSLHTHACAMLTTPAKKVYMCSNRYLTLPRRVPWPAPKFVQALDDGFVLLRCPRQPLRYAPRLSSNADSGLRCIAGELVRLVPVPVPAWVRKTDRPGLHSCPTAASHVGVPHNSISKPADVNGDVKVTWK